MAESRKRKSHTQAPDWVLDENKDLFLTIFRNRGFERSAKLINRLQKGFPYTTKIDPHKVERFSPDFHFLIIPRGK